MHRQIMHIDWGDLLTILRNVWQIVLPKRCSLVANQGYYCLPQSISQWGPSYGTIMEEDLCLGEWLIYFLKLLFYMLA